MFKSILTHLVASSGFSLVRDGPLGAPAFVKLAYCATFHPTLYCVYGYLSPLGLKLIHVRKGLQDIRYVVREQSQNPIMRFCRSNKPTFPFELIFLWLLFCELKHRNYVHICKLAVVHNRNHRYRQVSNIRRTLVGNKIVDNSDVVGASPVGAAPTKSSLST